MNAKPWENLGVSREEWEVAQQVLPLPGEKSYKELAREALHWMETRGIEVEIEVTLENGVRALLRGPKEFVLQEIERLKQDWKQHLRRPKDD